MEQKLVKRCETEPQSEVVADACNALYLKRLNETNTKVHVEEILAILIYSL